MRLSLTRWPVLFVVPLVALAACAQLIGAGFDDAKLADDAGFVSVDGAPLEGDSSNGGDGSVVQDNDGGLGFDAQSPGSLLFWVSADRGVGDGGALSASGSDASLVPRWSDLSGNGHDLVQPVALQQPTWVEDAAPNGLPAMHFDRSRFTCFGSTWLGSPGNTGSTVFIVAKGEPSSMVRFQGSGPGYFIFPWNSHSSDVDASPSYFFLVTTGVQSGQIRAGDDDLDRWTLKVARLEVGKLGGMQTFRNGELLESTTLEGDAMPVSDGFQVGCAPGQTSELAQGDVAEIMVYGSALSNPERQAVEGYLKAKWGLVY